MELCAGYDQDDFRGLEEERGAIANDLSRDCTRGRPKETMQYLLTLGNWTLVYSLSRCRGSAVIMPPIRFDGPESVQRGIGGVSFSEAIRSSSGYPDFLRCFSTAYM